MYSNHDVLQKSSCAMIFTIAGFLAFLLLTSCSSLLLGCSDQDAGRNNNDASSIAGSVTEYDVTLPGSIDQIAALSCSKDGKAVYALTGGVLPGSTSGASSDEERTLLWATEDQGKTWNSVYGLPGEIEDSGIAAGAINADGDCFIAAFSNVASVQGNESGMPAMDFFFISRDGSLLEVSEEFGLVDAVKISFVADDRVLVDDYSKAFLVDTSSGKVVARYDTAVEIGGSIAAAPVSEGVFVISGYDRAQCYVGLTGETCDTPAGLQSMLGDIYTKQPQSMVFYSSEETLYCADAAGVYKYTSAADQYGKLFSFTELMLGGGEPYMLCLAVDGDDTAYLNFFSPGLMSTAFKAYGLAGSDSTDSASVSVYTLESNSMLNSAILHFRDSNPEIQWSVEVGVDGEKAKTAEDAIRQLNARLLAGEGPDVILLDGLPIDSYIDKQVLADLSGVLSSEGDVEKTLFSNVAKTYSRNGQTFALPMSFYFYGAQGSESFLEKSSDAESLTNELISEAEADLFRGYENQYSQNPDAFSKFRETIKTLYGLHSPNFVKNGRMDSAVLETYYSSCKALQEAMSEKADKNSIEEEASSILYQALDSISGSSQNGIGVVAGVVDPSALLQQQRDSQVAWSPIPASAACFEPQMTIGVNSTTSRKSEAEGFVRYMLSSEFQDSLVMSFPVNKESLKNILLGLTADNHADTEGEEKLLYEMILGGESSLYVYLPDEEAEIMACIKSIEALSTPINGDAVIREAVFQNLGSYLDGSITLSQAVSEAENKGNLYLAE